MKRKLEHIRKSKNKFVRLEPFRYPRPRTLIVCEGSKTEPRYFRFLARIWRLTSITIEGEKCGSDPMSVVDCAIELRDTAMNTGNRIPFDEIWVVFDKNGHTNLKRALNKAKGNNMKVALSNPCFEYWYLLHFAMIAPPCENCDRMIRELKQFYPNYTKANIQIYETLTPKTEIAIQNADSLLTSRYTPNPDLTQCNPSTHVQLLVRRLKDISAQ